MSEGNGGLLLAFVPVLDFKKLFDLVFHKLFVGITELFVLLHDLINKSVGAVQRAQVVIAVVREPVLINVIHEGNAIDKQGGGIHVSQLQSRQVPARNTDRLGKFRLGKVIRCPD